MRTDSPLRARLPWVAGLALFVAIAAPGLAVAETPPEEESAIQEIRRFASNIQKNRDGTVRFVRFSRPSVKDEHLTHLKAFQHIDYLAVVTPTVTDAGLANIGSLTNLDTLVLSGAKLTDGGMPALDGLAKLQRLYLDDTQVSDEGLAHVAGLTALEVLSLENTSLTDAGLKHLAGLENLEVLVLNGTAVSDDGLAQLKKLPKLKTLELARTAVSGPGLDQLLSLKQLETLDLSGAEVTAEAVGNLTELPKLKRLLLYDTPVGGESLAAVRAALPKARVSADPAPGREQSAFERFLNRDGQHDEAPAGSVEQQATDNGPVLEAARERFAATDETPDFQRHVIPLLGRLGCNGRSCHGSFQGKGGFRLSMFGYDFEADLEALTGGEDPRADRENPAESLILHKPTSEYDHGGGERFKKGGWEHQLLLRWVQGGAKGVPEDAAKLIRLDVTPPEIVFEQPGETAQLKVVAVWSDGTREDVTCLTRFQTNDDSVAEVTPDGLVRAQGAGDTYVIALYDNGVFSTQVILPHSKLTGEQFPDVPTPTRIDELVVAKLSKLGIVPSELSSDEEFLRRVSLDIAGTLPTPSEVREFVADASPSKRARKIDELLERSAYVEWWTNLLCDLTGSNAQHLGTTDMNQPAAGQWRQWIRRRVEENVGWDRIAAGLLLAQSRRPGQTYEEYAAEQSAYMRRSEPDDFAAADNPMHYYWFRSDLQRPADRALSFGYVFLGVRLECAQCHKHPFDQWSKQDFEQFTGFFARIKAGVAPEAASAQKQLKTKLGVPDKLNTAALRRQMYMRVSAEGKSIPWNEIYIEPPGDKPQPARLLGGEEVDLSRWEDPRELLMEWLVSEDNPYFARAFVNRIWAHYFNVGIVDPPDDFNLANPPSNKALLDYLAREFIDHGYDIKWLHRAITGSRTYQLSWKPNETNRDDRRNFSRAVPRRLPAEVVVDAILQATDNEEALAAVPTNVAGRKIAQHPRSFQARGIDYSLLIFGKPLRTTNCDCERQNQPTLLQSLYVRNDHELLGWLERKDGWLAGVAKELGQPLSPETTAAAAAADSAAEEPQAADPEVIEGLIDKAYLRTLSRKPRSAERERAREHLAASANTVEGLRDLMWALLNTQEFLTNH